MGLVVLVGMLGGAIVMRRHCGSIVVLRYLSCQRMTIVRVVLHPTLRHTILATALTSIWLGRAHDDTIIGMGLDVFLEILGTLESLATELAFVRFQGNMYSNVGGDVVALDSRGPALTPSAGEVQVVSGLAADMSLADVLLPDH